MQPGINTNNILKDSDNMDKIVLIPAYEPDEHLIEVLTELRSAGGLSPVVIDDGSGEKCAEVFRQAEQLAVVLHHEVNRGKGAALRTGLTYISGHFPADAVVVTADADGQHKAYDIAAVGEKSEEEPGKLVVGCRRFSGDVPARSKFGNTVTRGVYRMVTGVSLSDTQTGLRAFTADLIPFMLSIPGDRYEYEMNVLLECTRKGIKLVEVPIETVYLDEKNTASHFDTLRDSWRIYKDILKFAGSSLIGFGVDYLIYSLLIVLTGRLTLSNIGARVVSSCVNYYINKRLVFQSDGSVLRTAAGYFSLAACILAANTLLLNLLVRSAGVNEFLAKVLVEIVLFSISWLVQRFIIFKK